MATRSIIAVWDDTDRVIQARYCHSDGYPEYNGIILQNNYKKYSAARSLINQIADFSYIGPTLADCKVYDEVSDPWTSFPDDYMNGLQSLANGCGAEWVYFYVKNKWYVAQNTYPFKFLPLKQVLAALENPVAKEFGIAA